MLITSHLAATTGIVLIANTINPNIDSKIILMSYILGVGIDIDHVIFYPRESFFHLINGSKEFIKNPHNSYKTGTKLHTYLQEPIFPAVVFMFSLLLVFITKSIVILLPAVCFSAHILMDSIINMKKQWFYPFSKKYYEGPIKQNVLRELIISSSLLLLEFVIFFLI